MARITDVLRGFSGGEIAPELKGIKGADIYKTSGLMFENYNPRPQGRMTSRPSIDKLAAATGSDVSNMIRLNIDDGRGFVFIVQDLAPNALSVQPVIVVYDANGQVGYDRDVPQGAGTSQKQNTNDLLLNFDSAPSFTGGDYMSVYIEITDPLSSVTYKKTLTNCRVVSVTGNNVVVNFKDPEIEAIADNTAIQFADTKLLEVMSASVTGLSLIQTINTASIFSKTIAPISFSQVDSSVYFVNGVSERIGEINFDDTLNEGEKFTLIARSTTGTNVDFPKAIGFYEQRLILGKGQTVYLSRTNQLFNFTTGTNSTDAMAYTMAGLNNNVASIRWIQATEKFLLVGTVSGNFIVRGAGEFDPITPNAITIRPIDSLGSAEVDPVISDSRVYFVERNSENVRALEFNFGVRGYKTADLNLLAKHIGREKITRLAFYQREPNRIFAVLGNGELASLLVDTEGQGPNPFSRIKHADGDIVDCQVAFDGEANDRLFLTIRREINGQPQFFLEILDLDTEYRARHTFNDSDEATDDANYAAYLKEKQVNDVRLDSRELFGQEIRGNVSLFSLAGGVREFAFIGKDDTNQRVRVGDRIIETDGPGRAVVTKVIYDDTVDVDNRITVNVTTEFSKTSFNLPNQPQGEVHLVRDVYSFTEFSGREVGIVIDSKVYKRTVSAQGVLDLSDFEEATNPETAIVYIGLIFKSIYKSMPLIGVSQMGASDSKIKNISNMFLELQNSLGISYGTDFYNLENIVIRKNTDSLLDQVPYFSGTTEPLYVEDNSEREVCMYIVQSNPFPANIISMSYDITAGNL